MRRRGSKMEIERKRTGSKRDKERGNWKKKKTEIQDKNR